MGKGWQEALDKGSFCKNSSKKVWQFESNEKDIAVDVGTENLCSEQIAQKSQYSACQNPKTVGKDLLDQIFSLVAKNVPILSIIIVKL